MHEFCYDSHLVPVQLCLSECLDSNLLKSDNNETDKELQQDEGHDYHVEDEVNGSLSLVVHDGGKGCLGVQGIVGIHSAVHHTTGRQTDRQTGDQDCMLRVSEDSLLPALSCEHGEEGEVSIANVIKVEAMTVPYSWLR